LLARDRAFVRLQDAFRAAWPLWERADWGDPEAPLPIVQVSSRDDTLPLEMLPVFDLGTLPEPRTHDERVRAASRFLGFTAMVRRTVPVGTDADRLIRNHPALPMQFLRHKRLRSALREGRFLATLGDHVRVDGPWPTSGDEDATREALLDALYAGDPLNGGARSDPPVQVHHFACHCDTTGDDVDEYTLRLSNDWGRPRDISLGELRRAYRERFTADRDDRRHRGIVVLNACASSRTDPVTAASFAQWFVGSGHRAFVGTETDVPDGVASAFAAAFYGRLLEARRPLGEAVVWARRDLLRDFRNPLGLLYVVYGDTDLVVEHPRPGVYRAV
ncbi:MAG TPA: CHAT domain-containing protein, partial [Micromonosporaceae bacterium]|nr:CHAT domain-containing protein [Micromonosporaceae bacterium]